MNINIVPSVLEFKAPLTKPNTEIITITNNSDETVAFKVKTTAPKLYCVRPNSALVHPGQFVEVSVILLGLKEEPEADTKCNDKFLIVALPAPYDIGENSVADVWPKLETEFKPQSVSTKIKVKYIVEGTSGTDAISSGIDAAEPISSKTKELLDEKVSEDVSQEDRSKIDALNEKLDSTVAASASPSEKSSASTTSGQQIPSQSSPAPFTTIILLAIIAIIIAWLFM